MSTIPISLGNNIIPDVGLFALSFKINITQLSHQLGNIRLIDYSNIQASRSILNNSITEDTIKYIEQRPELFDKEIKRKWLFDKETVYSVNENFLNELNNKQSIVNNKKILYHILQFNSVNWNSIKCIDGLEDYVIHYDIFNNHFSTNKFVFQNFIMLSNWYEKRLESNVSNHPELFAGFDVNSFLKHSPHMFWILYLTSNIMIDESKSIFDFSISQYMYQSNLNSFGIEIF